MGRGRAKAKQTRVARDLKYRPVDTDFASLERELRGDSYDGLGESSPIPEAYAEYGAEEDDDGDDAEDDEAYAPRR